MQHGEPHKVVLVAPMDGQTEDQEEECQPENNLTNFESKISILCLFNWSFLSVILPICEL
jgi:hypothetical protein